ncbi:hemicentin-1-like [Hydractinia symbiolongicarpus]|uniref:hemicentin-1-like n=1 Tax=Hydractinia symbiolongicarpus TaxID=13093 RepID=UPI00254A04A4|nr:hemicentin-1-like [Hydractinia symbiolongicarpus]
MKSTHCIIATLVLVAVVSGCEKKYKSLGCYWEDKDGETLFNDRDNIDWKDFSGYLTRIACKCDKAAKEKGYDFFALRYYGICVGLSKIGHIEKRKGACMNAKFKDCDDAAPGECIGKDFAETIYEIGVDGGYGEWEKFGKCSVSCGTGQQTRTRPCNNPKPIANGNKCDVLGPAEETRECDAKKDCPVNGKFGEWSSYGPCSAKCGGGSQTRTRECDSPAPAGTGKKCVGPTTESRECGKGDCSVDGGFGDWSSYSSCSKTCGGGVQTRTRECNNPTPLGSGKDCAGAREETRGCANDFCKGPTGVAKAQELVEKFLKSFHKTEYPDKTPSGKFYKAIFDIQKAVAEEFISVDPSTKGKTVEERLKDLESFLKVATEGGSIDFARATLGKGLFTFMKKKIKDGLPIDEIDKAADGYLKSIKDEIGEQSYNQIISSQGDSTLMFAMDTTGSMKDEITASKAIAKSIIDATRDFEVDYILSPFNDPGTGPVTYKSEKERAGFITAISNLRARGGGDCPELAIKGMLNALDQGPKYGSPMFVFTDATAKDDSAENLEALKSAADMNSATITFFTNLNGCTGSGKTGIDSYKDIASYTSGQIFPLKNEAELLKFKDYVASSLSRDTMIASGGTIKSKSKRSVSPGQNKFSVDDGIAKLIVSIATSAQNTAQYVTLTDPAGKTVTALNTMSMIRIFQIDNPPSGVYSLVFPSGAGKYEYTAEAVSKDAIEFAHNFMYQENPRKESPPFSLYNPITGVENQMIIRLGGVHRIDMSTIRVDLVDLHGKALMSNLKLSDLDAADEVLSTMLTPPTESFRVRLTGQTKTGAPFERISRGVSKASNVFVRPMFAGDEFTVTSGERNVAVQVQALVFGSSESQPLTFTVKARRGSITRSASKNIRKMGYVKLIYNAPTGMKGKTETIGVTVTNTRTGEKSTNLFSILLK